MIANLPYIPSSRLDKLPSSVKDYEPHAALDGGPKGTILIQKLIDELPKRLNPDGLAILEIDETHTLRSFEVPKALEAKIEKDQFEKNRFLTLKSIPRTRM